MLIVVLAFAVLVLWGVIENRWVYRKLMRGDLFVHYSSQNHPRPGPSPDARRKVT
jgi:hypothetical protein